MDEKMVEDWLFENPHDVKFLRGNVQVDYWLARQLVVPSGRIDLLGRTTSGNIVVVEIKNKQINSEALAQVSRYKFDIRMILEILNPIRRPYCYKAVIGLGAIHNKVLYEARALHIFIKTFEYKVELSGDWVFTDSSKISMCEEYDSISKNNIFSEWKPSQAELEEFYYSDRDNADG